MIQYNFDNIGLNDDITITFSYEPTNALIGTYKLNDVRSDDYVAAPTITFTKDESLNTLTVVQADIGVRWSDINMTATDGTNSWHTYGLTGNIIAGDTIEFDGNGIMAGDITIRFAYTPTNALIGTYKLNGVINNESKKAYEVAHFTTHIYGNNFFSFDVSNYDEWDITWTPIDTSVPFMGTIYHDIWTEPPISPSNVFDSIYSVSKNGSRKYSNVGIFTLSAGFYIDIDNNHAEHSKFDGIWSITITGYK